MSIKLKGSTSGSVSLDVPAAVSGGDVSLTLPNGVGSAGQYLRNSGTAGTLEFGDFGGPAFRATVSTSSPPTFTHNVNTKIPFTSETFDTDACFDSTTNYRFTPTTAGYYQVNLIGNFIILTNKNVYGQLSIKKSGITYSYLQMYENNPMTSGRMSGNLSEIVSMNGTTDYIEGFMYYYNYTDLSGTIATETVASTFMSASFVRAL